MARIPRPTPAQAAPAPIHPARPTGGMEAVMMAARAAVEKWNKDDVVDDASVDAADDLQVARAAASLFPVLDAQQAVFALACASMTVDGLKPFDTSRLRRVQAILTNVVVWIATTQGADLTVPEVTHHLIRPSAATGDGDAR